MPFELHNAPATFQCKMDVILSTVKWKFALVYLHDIVTFPKSLPKHIGHDRSILTLLLNAKVELKL